MDTRIANPLQSLLQQASKLPSTGEVAQFNRRFEGATKEVLLLCDVSGSMDEPAGSRKKIAVLQDTLDQIRPQFPAARIVAFNSTVQETFDSLPPPDGSTALHYALEYAQQYHPQHTIVISDGQPDDEAAALKATEKLTGIIDVVYCGPDSDKAAIAFMQRLARSAGGRVVRTDWNRTNGRALAPTVWQLLLKA